MAAIQDNDLLTPGIYRHYKGNEYNVIGVGKHTETEELMVIYRPLYKSDIDYWMRPYVLFVDTVLINGEEIPRFVKVS